MTPPVLYIMVWPQAALNYRVFAQNATGTDPASGVAYATMDPPSVVHASVCGRRMKIHRAILAQLPDILHCGDVTAAHLQSIADLDVTYELQLERPKSGNLDGLTSLRVLDMSWAVVRFWPDGIFEDLKGARGFRLNNNGFTVLPGSFAEPASLGTLSLAYNQQLRILPPDLFRQAPNLKNINLESNRLEEVPPNKFKGLSQLQLLCLDHNRLQALSAGVFEGLLNLKTFYLDHNSVDPLISKVSLRKEGNGRFSVTVDTPAPVETAVAVNVVNGRIDGSATHSVVTGSGRRESEPVEVTRIAGSSGAISVVLGEIDLPISLPSGFKYVLDKKRRWKLSL